MKGGEEGTERNTSLNKQREENCKTTKFEHVIEGKKFVVTRHFVEEKDLQSLIMELAAGQAKREMGLL